MALSPAARADVITRLTNGVAEREDNGLATQARLSADGRYAIVQTVERLSPDDTNTFANLYRFDIANETFELVDSMPLGPYSAFDVSADGQRVVFTRANAFQPYRVYVRDFPAGAPQVVPATEAGVDPSVSVSGDGRFIAVTTANELIPGEPRAARDAYRIDLDTNAVVRLSVATDGGAGNGESVSPKLSADGRFAAFESGATNLVADGITQSVAIFRRDVVAGITVRASRTGEATHFRPFISADGRYVAFNINRSPLTAARFDATTGLSPRVNLQPDEFYWDPSPLYSMSADGDALGYMTRSSAYVHRISAGTYQRQDVGADGPQVPCCNAATVGLNADGSLALSMTGQRIVPTGSVPLAILRGASDPYARPLWRRPLGFQPNEHSNVVSVTASHAWVRTYANNLIDGVAGPALHRVSLATAKSDKAITGTTEFQNVVSSDGTRAIIMSSREDGGCGNDGFQVDAFVIEVETDHATCVSQLASGFVRDARLSPDGNFAFFEEPYATPRRVSRVHVASGNRTLFPADLVPSSGIDDISHDGDRVLFSTTVPWDASDTDTSTDVYEYSFSGATVRRISTASGNGRFARYAPNDADVWFIGDLAQFQAEGQALYVRPGGGGGGAAASRVASVPAKVWYSRLLDVAGTNGIRVAVASNVGEDQVIHEFDSVRRTFLPVASGSDWQHETYAAYLPDGIDLVFDSRNEALVAGDTNQYADVFLRDTDALPADEAANDAFAVAEDAAPTSLAVFDNDVHYGSGAAAIESAGAASHGTVQVSADGASVTYEPAADYCAATADSFDYTLVSGNTASVSVTVTCVNDPPFVTDASATIASGRAAGTVVATVAATDVDGPSLAHSITGGNTGGAFDIEAATGVITVAEPAAVAVANSPFALQVTVSDGGAPALSAGATVMITVTESPDPVFAHGFE